MSQETLVLEWDTELEHWFIEVRIGTRDGGWISMARELNKVMIDVVRQEAITRHCDAFIREKKSHHLKPIIVMGAEPGPGNMHFL